jgi:hypothetical protein
MEPAPITPNLSDVAFGFTGGLPPAEQPNGVAIYRNLNGLESVMNTLVSAMELFKHSTVFAGQLNKDRGQDWLNKDLYQRSVIANGWPFIAAREVAMSVWHFGEGLRAIKGILRATHSLNPLVDWKGVKVATKTYTNSYGRNGKIGHLRDAISHSTLLTEFPKLHAAGTNVPGVALAKGASIIIAGNLTNDTFVYTWKGHARELAITDETVIKVREVLDLFVSAIAGASDELKRRVIEQRMVPSPLS